MKQIKACTICKKHTSTLYSNRCKSCYDKYKAVEQEMFRRAKGLTIRVFQKGGNIHWEIKILGIKSGIHCTI